MKILHRFEKYIFIIVLIFLVALIWKLAAHTPPKINPIPNKTITVGETYATIGSFRDPDATSWKAYYSFSDEDYNVPELTLNANKTFYLKHIFKKPGRYTFFVIIIDNHGAIGSTTVIITVKSKQKS